MEKEKYQIHKIFFFAKKLKYYQNFLNKHGIKSSIFGKSIRRKKLISRYSWRCYLFILNSWIFKIRKGTSIYIYNWVVHIKRYNFSLFWIFFRQPWTKVSPTFLLMMLIAASSPCIGRCVITSSLYHRVYIYTKCRTLQSQLKYEKKCNKNF